MTFLISTLPQEIGPNTRKRCRGKRERNKLSYSSDPDCDSMPETNTHNIFNMAMATNFNMQNLNQPIGLLVELLGKISFGDR